MSQDHSAQSSAGDNENVERAAQGPQSAAPAPAAGPAAPGVPPSPEAQVREAAIELLRAQVEEYKDKALRWQAELDNYRKRAARQMEEERRYAALGLIRDLLPVLDNLGRALEAAEKAHDTARLVQGVHLVLKQLEGLLERHHCRKIEALGQPFDPQLHEAIAQQPSAEAAVHTVLSVVQTGYQLHDRVVRPSQVIVAAPPPDGEEQPPGGEQGITPPPA